MSNERYLNKVTSQHKTKPKFMSWLGKNLDLVEDIAKVLNKMDDDFDVYRAVGKQQDILGDVIGRSRSLDFQPADGSNPRLDDDLYRVVQLAKISMNQWDGTIPGAVELWKNLFPDYQIIIEDNQDMSMDLSIIGLASSFEKELMSRGYIAPKPEGVRLNYEFYMYLYQAVNTAFFASSAYIFHHYSIDGKATIAKDTAVYATENIGVSQNPVQHITINGIATAKDVSLYSYQRLGITTGITRHISIDGITKTKDISVETNEALASTISSSKHYIID